MQRAEIVAILGENGAGKTTLLKIVGGLARADAGHVTLVGYGAPGSSPEMRRRISYGGGERGYYYRLTTRENLRLFATLSGLRGREREERVESAAALLDLTAHLERRFGDLSTGLRQRLSIARALLPDPDVLLLDEPTRTLDPLHAADLRALVRDTLVKRYGKTVLLATNVLDEVYDIADRCLVLRGGYVHELEFGPGHAPLPSARELFGKASHA